MKHPVLLLAALLPLAATAQTPVPQTHVPSSVLLELRTLESQFDLALSQDCASERCFSKGCVYRDHVTVDMPRTASLPGLAPDQGPGSVPVQEYLTSARCEFAHEKALATKDVQALVRRLEQRLSKGWLRVNVARQILEPVAEELRQPPPPPAPPPAPEPVVEAKPAEPVAPATWEAGVALRELWVSLLPHFSWMIAVVLGTIAALLIIWAVRRLGRESIEEKAMAAQLAAGTLAPAGAQEASSAARANGAAHPDGSDPRAEEAAFISGQQQMWNERIAQSQLENDDGMVVEMLRRWLKEGEFGLLAKAIFLFGDRLSEAFPSDGELAVRKVEFADFLRNVDEKDLPSDAEFFHKLNQHAISSSLLAQEDAEVYRSLREEFGAAGIAGVIERLAPRPGALLFAFAPPDVQQEVARIMSPELRLQVASQLLSSNRISREETSYILSVLGAARSGQPIPAAPRDAGIPDRGREFDAPGALSVLLPAIEIEDRQALFTQALQRSAGAFPAWYENILYGDMLMKIPDELRADLLLEVDLKGLAGWSSLQGAAWQDNFMRRLAPSLQNAVKANMSFSSRADQLRAARRGHDQLVSAVKKHVARGKVSFAEIVA